MNKHIKQRGFTLIELLIVIAVMAILMSVVFVALNPMARFEDARNNTRWTDVDAILSAIKLHQVDNDGRYLDSISALTEGTEYMIGTGEDGCGSYSSACNSVNVQPDCVDLEPLATNGYLPSVPYDEKGDPAASDDFTFYYLIKHSNGAITIGSCNPEQGSNETMPNISVKR